MIENLKDLEKLLKLLRKQGITTFQCKDLNISLGDLPQDASQPASPQTQDELPPTLSDEQLAFYSTGITSDENQ